MTPHPLSTFLSLSRSCSHVNLAWHSNLFVLYCYGGKEYFDSSIKVLFDIFPLLMGDEHEIYIYIYVYYFWRNVWSKKSLSESSSFYAPTEPLSKKHRIKMFDVFILRRTRHCTLFNVNSEYSLVKYFVIVVSNTSIHNSKSLCEEWVWTIKDLNLLQLL